jgi:branched-chain amino acid transport system ATP-binding protein
MHADTSARAASPAPATDALLEARGLSLSFGGLKAVSDFSLSLPRGSLYGLIGPNGAGKTTIFNILTGVYQPDRGELLLDSKNLVGRRPHVIAASGIARTFQNIRLFGDLSVLDNVRLGAQLRHPLGAFRTLLRGKGFFGSEARITHRAFEILDVLGLADSADAAGTSLSYGHQRRLEIARALATSPRVLLLDEPAAGMNTQEKLALAETIRRLPREFNVSILLIDHDMGLVMGVCDQITVVDHGVVIAHGPPAQIQNDQRVIAAYLGEPTDDE